MSINDLPFDVTVLLFSYLMDDQAAFINLSSTCKKFQKAAECLIDGPLWVERRPVRFTVRSHHYLLMLHGKDHPRPQRKQTCEVHSSVDSPFEECFYDELYSLTHSKYKRFSTLNFQWARVRGECFRAFADAIEANRLIAQPRVNAIVELDLIFCRIMSVPSLAAIISQLPNISYLRLQRVDIDPGTGHPPSNYWSYPEVEKYLKTSKPLEILSLEIDETEGLGDYVFMFFLKYLPAKKLYLSTQIMDYKRSILEIYPSRDVYNMKFDLYQPPEMELTFLMLLTYLRTHSSITGHLYLEGTRIEPDDLKLLLNDPNLQQLRISIHHFSNEDLDEELRVKITELVNEEKLSRVSFPKLPKYTAMSSELFH